ncbi:hypothetical protein [Desulfosporosinus sp. SB140]|uniref:hypothetical protein n=1 Tax=Desulfosporosinus paludis TaxID=3115649 RepID=UPI00388D33A0
MDQHLNTSDLAQILRLTPQRVNQLVKENILKREQDGKFNAPDSLEAYYKFKYQKDTELSFERERAGHEKAKREIAELELKQLKNGLVYASDIDTGMHDLIVNAKETFEPLVERCAVKVIGLRDPGVVAGILREEIYAALTTLSQTLN